MKALHPVINVVGILLIVPVMMLIDKIKGKDHAGQSESANPETLHTGTDSARS